MVSYSQIGYMIEDLLKYIEMLVFVRVVLSFFVRDLSNPIVMFIYTVTDPFLEPFKRFNPKSMAMLDFSPIMFYIFIEIMRTLVRSVI